MALERMDDFFAARVEGYDEHMIANVEGCKEAYPLVAELVPQDAKNLLDLGCGTGLELDYIFPLHPRLAVTGIDLTKKMLEKLKAKHPDKALTLICDDYFAADFGKERFDCAVSFETMHHFEKEKKTALYARVCEALGNGGIYIECDYMVDTQEEEDHWFAENERFRKEAQIPEAVYCHYDTPCTVENQLTMFRNAGFSSAEHIFRKGGTSIIIAKK